MVRRVLRTEIKSRYLSAYEDSPRRLGTELSLEDRNCSIDKSHTQAADDPGGYHVSY